ncbi:hypothetical protein Bca52824_024987 [Brassica carinata]|uniref:Uncharacterized protein n=1 Tax=Brassica carinata TaxID=52824 RepID=A0A8X7VL85_BRACI|nr:hypothetical protein Bca52824_024987 [Brassica carinata]
MIGSNEYILALNPEIQEGEVLQGYCNDDNDSEKNGDEHVLASSPLPMSLKFKPSTVVRSSNP